MLLIETEEPMQVGQKLLYVPNQSYGRQPEPYEVQVVSVGRKWAIAKDHGAPKKINIDTLAVDGGAYMSPGRCWYSRELWQESVEIKKYWDLFRKEIENHFNPPEQLSLEGIRTLYNRASMWSTK